MFGRWVVGRQSARRRSLAFSRTSAVMDFPFSYNSTPILRRFPCRESRFVIIKKIIMSRYYNNLKRSSRAPITAIITPPFDLYD